ncbi:DUF6555 family protein [Pseudomonas fluorescens]|uniref:DUF6555 family protein n=1 Tax=Pseudomonas fluorescens TaxID=294 RepID=UPI0012400E4A|nr:DUF6555 family protein [Pseudomonas fluorescens]
MKQAGIFVVEYRLHGDRKSFVIRSMEMNNAQAWQWASCDAGIAPIPKSGQPHLKHFSKPLAERYGITEVQWRESASLAWEEVQGE